MKSIARPTFFAPLPRLVALLLLAGAALAAGADGDRRVTATMVTGAVYPPGRWVPVLTKLTNSSAIDVNGTVTLEPTQGSLLRVSRDVRVPAHSSLVVELLGRFAEKVREGKKNDGDVALVTWRDPAVSGGSPVAEPLEGLSDSSLTREGRDATGMPGVTLLWVAGHDDSDRLDATEISGQLSARTSYGFDPQSIDQPFFPRHAEALDAVRLLAFDPATLASFDLAQQQAILGAVRGGATLLLTYPDQSAASNWLTPYLPLDVIGSYRPTTLHPREYEAIELLKKRPIALCIARNDATVTASDDTGALAAYTPLGFGRIAMTAFDVNDLSRSPATEKLWGDLIGTDRAAFHDPSALTDKSPAAEILPALIGASAPPWRMAAGVVGGYVIVIAALLFACGQARRPVAMAGCVGVSLLLTGALFGLTAARSKGQPLMVGRVTTLDVSGGTAVQNDLVTFFGQQRSDLAFDLLNGTLVTPIVSNNDATLSLWPSRVTRIASSSGKLETVWQARRSFVSPHDLSAAVEFGPAGATLVTRSTFDQSLESPRLIFNSRVVPLPTIAAGDARQVVGPSNPPGVFADSASVIADERSKLRADLVQKVSVGAKSANGYAPGQLKSLPVLTAFATSDPAFRFAEASEVREQSLVRAPLTLRAPAIGSDVRIDPPFISVHTGGAGSIPYMASTNSWNEGNLTGTWLVGLGAPHDIGRIRPRTLVLNLDVSASSMHITVRRGQCSGGQARENAAGDIVAEWTASGRADATLDLNDSDIDANGWVWLRFEIEPVIATSYLGDNLGGNWQLRRLDATLTGKVDGPPQADVVTWPIATSALRAPAKPQPHNTTPTKAAAKPK